jgi:hypothetical protein
MLLTALCYWWGWPGTNCLFGAVLAEGKVRAEAQERYFWFIGAV